jgi:large subunit ribosomal protein L9
MQVILLERIEKLGQMGDVVRVKPGYARNFLLPQKKALRATEANFAYFETQRVELEAANLKRRQEAEDIARRMEGLTLVIIRQAGETGHLYGSVTARDVAEAISEAGFHVERNQVQMAHPIKILGIHSEKVALHPEVVVEVTLNVAPSEEAAVVQAERGGSAAQLAEREEGQAAEPAAQRGKAGAEAPPAQTPETQTGDQDAAGQTEDTEVADESETPD